MFYAIQTKLLVTAECHVTISIHLLLVCLTTWCALGKAQLSGVHIHIGKFLSAQLNSLFTTLKVPQLANFYLTVVPLRHEPQ